MPRKISAGSAQTPAKTCLPAKAAPPAAKRSKATKDEEHKPKEYTPKELTRLATLEGLARSGPPNMKGADRFERLTWSHNQWFRDDDTGVWFQATLKEYTHDLTASQICEVWNRSDDGKLVFRKTDDADAWLKAVYSLYYTGTEKEVAWWHAVMTSHTIDHVAGTTTEVWTYYGPYVHCNGSMRHVKEVLAKEKAADAASIGSGGADGSTQGSSSCDMATSSHPPARGGSSTPDIMAVSNEEYKR